MEPISHLHVHKCNIEVAPQLVIHLLPQWHYICTLLYPQRRAKEDQPVVSLSMECPNLVVEVGVG